MQKGKPYRKAHRIANKAEKAKRDQDQAAALEVQGQKEPWQMTKEEWDREFEKGRPSSSGSHQVTAAATIGKSSAGAEKAFSDLMARQDFLKMGLKDEVRYKGEPDEFHIPARHEQVVKLAMELGKPVPSNVLEQYPEIEKTETVEHSSQRYAAIRMDKIKQDQQKYKGKKIQDIEGHEKGKYADAFYNSSWIHGRNPISTIEEYNTGKKIIFKGDSYTGPVPMAEQFENLMEIVKDPEWYGTNMKTFMASMDDKGVVNLKKFQKKAGIEEDDLDEFLSSAGDAEDIWVSQDGKNAMLTVHEPDLDPEFSKQMKAEQAADKKKKALEDKQHRQAAKEQDEKNIQENIRIQRKTEKEKTEKEKKAKQETSVKMTPKRWAMLAPKLETPMPNDPIPDRTYSKLVEAGENGTANLSEDELIELKQELDYWVEVEDGGYQVIAKNWLKEIAERPVPAKISDATVPAVTDAQARPAKAINANQDLIDYHKAQIQEIKDAPKLLINSLGRPPRTEDEIQSDQDKIEYHKGEIRKYEYPGAVSRKWDSDTNLWKVYDKDGVPIKWVPERERDKIEFLPEIKPLKDAMEQNTRKEILQGVWDYESLPTTMRKTANIEAARDLDDRTFEGYVQRRNEAYNKSSQRATWEWEHKVHQDNPTIPPPLPFKFRPEEGPRRQYLGLDNSVKYLHDEYGFKKKDAKPMVQAITEGTLDREGEIGYTGKQSIFGSENKMGVKYKLYPIMELDKAARRKIKA
jgi:hypothetical protein